MQNRSEIGDAELLIQVYDVSSFGMDSLIGETCIGLTNIYHSENHVMQHKWFILQNISKDYEKIMGYLKISANFVRSDQERANLISEDPKTKIKGSSISELSIPPQIKLDKKEINVCIYRGERIVKMDDGFLGYGGKADPFVKIFLGGLTIKSSIKDTLSPTYMEKLSLPIIYPTFIEKLRLSFKDYDRLQTNEYIGSISFKISDIMNGKYRKPFWANFYGAYADVKYKEIKLEMNKVPELASRFKGSLYMSIQMVSSETPRLSKKPLSEGEIINPPQKQEYQVILDLVSVANLFSKSDTHTIEINWGGRLQSSSGASFNNGVLEYFERIKLTEGFKVSTIDEVSGYLVNFLSCLMLLSLLSEIRSI